MQSVNKSRRNYLLAGLGLGALAAGALLKPSAKGRSHTPYFYDISEALDSAGVAKPSLLIDKTVLLDNVKTLRSHIKDRFAYRVVAKSLPSTKLLKEIMLAAQTDRLMLFHQPFANTVVKEIPNADVLFGKPMPVAAAANFYQQLSGDFKPEQQLQWLLDTPERLGQYLNLAQKLNVKMRINVEIDVGLHRGGVNNPEDFASMLATIDSNELLEFSGLMGYEPHVAKVPGDSKSHRDKSMAVYQSFLDQAVKHYGGLDSAWVLNAAGSPTYQLYDEGGFPHNELSAGSCLVKPTDFDLPTLADHKPAAYIATPVIKSLPTTQVPGVSGLGEFMSWWNPNRQQAFFTYGGYWKAKPESPVGLSNNPVMGRSTNQEMLNGSNEIDLKADDWVFLRPTQSEFVFLQFGDVQVYENGKIIDSWPVFS